MVGDKIKKKIQLSQNAALNIEELKEKNQIIMRNQVLPINSIWMGSADRGPLRTGSSGRDFISI